MRRLVVAVDVGRVVNPDGVRNQIEGGAVQATSWTLKERVRFDRRRVTSIDWESYPILRFSEVPAVDVELVDRPDKPSSARARPRRARPRPRSATPWPTPSACACGTCR